jgi:Fic family protein
MSDLTRYIAKEEPAVPLLMKAALMHVQFETIHPFLDGNGRLGRLLITLLLCAAGALGEPTLYLSLYFKRNRQSYYALLNAVRTHGAWEEWLAFFLTGVAETAREAADTAQRLHDLFSSDQEKVERIGRRAATAFRLFRLLIRTPVLSVQYAVEKLDLQPTTIGGALDALVKLDIIRETTGRGRNRLFAYDAYLRILAEGTEP